MFLDVFRSFLMFFRGFESFERFLEVLRGF